MKSVMPYGITGLERVKCTESLSSLRSTHLGEGCHITQYDMLRLSLQLSCKLTFNLSRVNYLHICVMAFGLQDHFDVFRIAHSHNANVLCNLPSCLTKCLINMPSQFLITVCVHTENETLRDELLLKEIFWAEAGREGCEGEADV